MAEWPDLDLEARQFTSKILGEDVVPVEQVITPAQSQVPVTDLPPDEDLETKAEL